MMQAVLSEEYMAEYKSKLNRYLITGNFVGGLLRRGDAIVKRYDDGKLIDVNLHERKIVLEYVINQRRIEREGSRGSHPQDIDPDVAEFDEGDAPMTGGRRKKFIVTKEGGTRKL